MSWATPTAANVVESMAALRASFELTHDARADYAAGRDSRFIRRLSGISPAGSGADFHYDNEARWLHLIERARDIDRNDPVVGQGISRLCDNVLQDGVTVDPETGDEALDQHLRSKWQTWANDPMRCDAAQTHDFTARAKLAFRAIIVDGDTFALPLADGRSLAVEAHQVRNPRRFGGRSVRPGAAVAATDGRPGRLVHGILVDNNGAPLEYWIVKPGRDPARTALRDTAMHRVPARDFDGAPAVFHLANPKRAHQTRGISALAPAVSMIGMHDDLQFANLVRAQAAASFAIIRELDVEAFEAIQNNNELAGAFTAVGARGDRQAHADVAPGIMINGMPGETYKGFAPNVPNPEFFGHATMILSIIAVNLGIPIHLLLLDPTKTNFSGWRGAMDQARIGFKAFQRLLINRFYRPHYEWKLRDWIVTDPAIARAANRLGPALFRHRWSPPTWPYIQPETEAKADALRLEKRLTSPRRRAAERGLEWPALVAEIVEDNAAVAETALRRARAINQTFPEARLDWRELAHVDPRGRAPEVVKADGGGESLRTFKRELLTILARDKTVGDVLYNAIDIPALLAELQIKPDDNYAPPWLPVVAEPAGRLVSGEAITDTAGDIVGGDVRDPVPAPDAAGGKTTASNEGIPDAKRRIAGDSPDGGAPVDKKAATRLPTTRARATAGKGRSHD